MKNTTITTINNVAITIAQENQDTLVPIKPICEAIGINYTTQLEKIKSHPILSPTVALRGTVAADGKTREMACLPVEFVFGWLFTINPNNVASEAREDLMQYQYECYHALYNYFFGKAEKFHERERSFERTLTLQREQTAIKCNPHKTLEDFDRYLEIEREISTEISYRKAMTRDSIATVKTLFDEE